MSVAEFSTAMKNRALNNWFNKESNTKISGDAVNNIINSTNMYREIEKTASKNSFLMTKDTVRELLYAYNKISDDMDDDTINGIVDIAYTNLKIANFGVRAKRKTTNIKMSDGSTIPGVYFESIHFDAITDLVNKVIGLDSNQLQEKYHKGHVIGLNTELMRITATRMRSSLDKTPERDMWLNYIDKAIEYYKRLDFESANLQPAADIPIYAAVNKSINRTGKTKYLVEIQAKSGNLESSSEVQATIGSIRKLFSPGNLSAITMTKIIDNLSEKVKDPKFKEDLLEMRSSPSFKEMISKNILDVLKGTPTNQEFSTPNVEISRVKVIKPNLSELRSEISKQITHLENTKKVLKTNTSKLRNKQGQFTNLASLQTLLNQALALRIKENMGTGDARNILNYRTGRFSESVKVERLSQSREGMITAFYSYMKYPYATFSEGGAQQFPRSRDPKLLISKSIREIASTIVGNRMRAVNI